MSKYRDTEPKDKEIDLSLNSPVSFDVFVDTVGKHLPSGVIGMAQPTNPITYAYERKGHGVYHLLRDFRFDGERVVGATLVTRTAPGNINDLVNETLRSATTTATNR